MNNTFETRSHDGAVMAIRLHPAEEKVVERIREHLRAIRSPWTSKSDVLRFALQQAERALREHGGESERVP